MTKNITSSNSPISDELDLDSFLRRHNATFSDDDDEEDDQKPQIPDTLHRTIDDILNDSSSDSDHDVVSVSSSTPYSKTLISGEKVVNSTQTKFNLIQRLKSDEFASRKPPIGSQNSRNSSIFGSGVSRKPGAALAAVAAASRNVRIPRSGVMMSRRALNESLEGKVSDDELLGFVKDDVKFEGDNLNEVVGEVVCERENDEKDEVMMDSFDKCGVRGCEGSNIKEGIEVKQKGDDVEVNGRGDEKGGGELENGEDFGRKMEAVASDEKVEILDVERVDSGGFAEEEAGFFFDVEEKVMGEGRDVDENFVEGFGLSLEVKNEEKEEEDSGFVPRHVQEAGMSDESGTGRDELNFTSDDDEERIAQLEDEMDSESAEETLRSVKKPLELAEELEIKQASTGQD